MATYHILDSYIVRNDSRVVNHFDMLPEGMKDIFLKSLLIYELSGIIVGCDETLIPVAVFDYKNSDGEYWRHAAIREYNDSLPEYTLVTAKSGKQRKKATPKKSYKQGRTYTQNHKYLKAWVNACRHIEDTYGIPFLGCKGFEADDIAAALVSAFPDDNIILNTLDKDWLGLVEPNRVSWFSHTGYYPGLRHVVTWGDFLAYPLDGKPMYEYGFTKPEDIWVYKSEHGDASDNLLAGTPLDIIDLKQPRFRPTADFSRVSDISLPDELVEKAIENLMNLGWLSSGYLC